MPCQVSLLELVRIADTRPLWPTDFQAFIKAIEDDPMNHDPLGPLADWLGEEFVNEMWLEKAVRFLMKRNDIEIRKNTRYSSIRWDFQKLPKPWLYGLDSDHKCDCSTFAGLLAHLALSIKEQIEAYE